MLQVELTPANTILEKPCLLKIPHFAADTRGEKHMFIAALHEPNSQRQDEDNPDNTTSEGGTFIKMTTSAQFNVATGYATVWITKLGVFYVCSDISDGIDYAVTSYNIPSYTGDTTFNAVGFDWIEGEANLWTRTSLDRPPGKDGPVYLRRKVRLAVDFDAKRIAGTVPKEAPTFPDTFVLASNNYNLFTGLNEENANSKNKAQDEPFDAIEYHVLVVPGHMMSIIEEKRATVEQVIKDLKTAEEQAVTLGSEFDAEAQKPYLDRIQAAKLDLKVTRQKCLPWSEKNAAPSRSQSVAVVSQAGSSRMQSQQMSSQDAPNEGTQAEESANAVANGHASESMQQQEASAERPASLNTTEEATAGATATHIKQSYKELPVWEGKDLAIVFGAQMYPDAGFQEDHLSTSISLVVADRNAEERRLLEVPEMPGLGGRFKKVWVGPPKEMIFSYPSILTRASFAGIQPSYVVLARLCPWYIIVKGGHLLTALTFAYTPDVIQTLTCCESFKQSSSSMCGWERGRTDAQSRWRRAATPWQTSVQLCSRIATDEIFLRLVSS